MKNSKQKTLRHGSAVFTDKHCLYRIAVVRYVDSLFYEPGDACRCHSRCYSLIVRELFGIGKNTFRHYLHYPSDRLTGVVIPRETQGAAEALCDIGQEIAGNASSGLPA